MRPPEIRPAPVHVPTFTTSASCWPLARPARSSARAIAFTSLSATHGTPSASAKASLTDTPCQSGLTGGWIVRPVANSTGAATPTPQPTRTAPSPNDVSSCRMVSMAAVSTAAGPASIPISRTWSASTLPSRLCNDNPRSPTPISTAATTATSPLIRIRVALRPPSLGRVSASVTSPALIKRRTESLMTALLRPVSRRTSACDSAPARRITETTECVAGVSPAGVKVRVPEHL